MKVLTLKKDKSKTEAARIASRGRGASDGEESKEQEHQAAERQAWMGKRAGAKYEALKRLDSLMAVGEKRSHAKDEAREHGQTVFAFSDGKMHAYRTRESYQIVVMPFLEWCRDWHELRVLAQIDEQAEILVASYLRERLFEGKSVWTLKRERSALRLFFSNRDLASSVVLPARQREHITHSRGPAQRDAHFQPANWQPLLQFCLACGLRAEELRHLLVKDIYQRPSDQQLVVRVKQGKGGRFRQVVVFAGREQAVLAVVEGCDPEAHVFEQLPNIDYQSYRRQFAQELYMELSGRPLPSATGSLRAEEIDEQAALEVSRRLGHNRSDVVWNHYLR